ncbi:putative E3 ubiquitin-protein ligase HTD2 [Chytridiales sp. JEL 0842]|nr:putative E3 ubiquitin-protein ligase HTD2 [Chytridiales sp. JEL 0842]
MVIDFKSLDEVIKSDATSDSTALLSASKLAETIKAISEGADREDFKEDDERINAILVTTLYLLSARFSAIDTFQPLLELVNLFSTRKISSFLRRSFLYHELTVDKAYVSKVFSQLVGGLQNILLLRVAAKELDDAVLLLNRDSILVHTTFCLDTMNRINDEYEYVPFAEFYNSTVEDQIKLKEEFPLWKTNQGFSFLDFPFLLSSAFKGEVLKVESMTSMRHELQDSFFRAMFIGVNSPYLQLEVRRDHVVRDAISQLSLKSAHDLKKQLRVSFAGEEGIDEGGIQKEFFEIVIKEIFDEKHGMFNSNSESNLCWFAKHAIADNSMLEEYTLVGKLLGLAIYNGVTLDVPFPLALYKKLLKSPITLEDLTELDPSLSRGMKSLLTFDGDISETFGWTFQIEYDTPYQKTKMLHNLKPNGANIPLNKDNREEFVDLYVQFIFDKSISGAFDAFCVGFDAVVERQTLQLFRPHEFQDLIVGTQHLDFKALEKNAQYDGFEPDSEFIKNFWEILHGMTEEEKRMLLFFTTGSERAPIGGLSKLNFVIVRNGPDSDRLPTSHTCYNVLLLNEYSTKERLKERLYKALSFAKCGFFLL